MFTPCVVNDKICSQDRCFLEFPEFHLSPQEWIVATYHIAQYIITVAAIVAKDGVRDKIEWHSIVFLLFNKFKLKPQQKLTLEVPLEYSNMYKLSSAMNFP